jgi:DNA-nicking Smr family endonuclease
MEENDKQLFLDAVADVKPLKLSDHLHAHTRAKCRHRARQHDTSWDGWTSWEHTHTTPMVGKSSSLLHMPSAKQDKRLQRLRSGNFSTRCVIDLHGLSENAAEQKLTDWLARCRHRTDHYALIIHGKGIGGNAEYPVLKNFVNWWLRNQPRVLAFCSALPSDGGTGAVYVLLAPTT